MASVEKDIAFVAEDLAFPEGPVALPGGDLLVCEIARGTVKRIFANGGGAVLADVGGGPNGLAMGPDGCVYICNNGGFTWINRDGVLHISQFLSPQNYSGGRIERLDPRTGDVKVLYRQTEHGPLNGPNDLVFDRAGGFWFTDLGKYREKDTDRGAVYYALPDGSGIRRVIFPMVTPNGIGLSPDGSTLYVAESQTARLWAFEVAEPGRIKPRPWPSPNGGDLVTGSRGYQIFDSLAVEADGRICIGTLVTGGISIIAPDGMHTEFLPLPDPSPTNICFGGPGLRTAFITLSQTGKLARLQWPRPGLRLCWQ